MSMDNLPVGTPAGRVADAGTFKIENVFPDKYYLNVSGLPEGAFIKSVKVANQEVIDKGLDLSNARTVAMFDVLLSLEEGPRSMARSLSTTSLPRGVSSRFSPTPSVRSSPTSTSSPRPTRTASSRSGGSRRGTTRLYAFAESQPELSRDPGLARPYERGAVKIDVDEGATERVELKALKPEDAQQ